MKRLSLIIPLLLIAVIISSQVLPAKSKEKVSIELFKAPPTPPLPPLPPPPPPPLPDDAEIGDMQSPTNLDIPTPDETIAPYEMVVPPKPPVPPAPPENEDEFQ